MDLIYSDVLNGEIIDRGVLNNYALDLSYGADENNFKLTAPLDGTRLKADQIVYAEGTEYGGVIDEIEVDTEQQMLIYTGRTWHGILENKILYPPKGHDYLYLNGEAHEVLATLLELMNIIPGDDNELYIRPENAFMKVSTEDSGIWVEAKVTSESGNYAKGYSFIRDMLYCAGAKLKIIDGILSAVPLIDYSNDDDFLAATDQFRAKRNYNSLNRLHCLGQGNLSERYAIDIYLDENGGILPYKRENVMTDADYYTDINSLADSENEEDIANFAIITDNMLTGLKEISDIYDCPNAQTTYHYELQTERPADWGDDLTPEEPVLRKKVYGYQNYFYQDPEADESNPYKNVPASEVVKDHDLQYEMPKDWISNFSDYYESTSNGWEKVASVNAYDPVSTKPSGWEAGAFLNYYKYSNGSYSKVTLVSGKIPLGTPPDDWETNYSDYYEIKDGKYVKVKGETPDPVYTPLRKEPPEWNTKFKEYYTTDGVGYTAVSGNSKDNYVMQTRKPSDWKTDWKNYYKKVKDKYTQLGGAKAPAWKANKYYTKYTEKVAPKFKDKKNPRTYYSKYQGPDVAPEFGSKTFYAAGKVVPAWGSETFYQKRNYPIWQVNKYYTEKEVRPVPDWTEDTYYTRHEDHYQSLIESALKRIQKNNIKDNISINLDEKRVYDINDRVGASDEVTGIGATERIIQKVVKISRGIASFTYKTGI